MTGRRGLLGIGARATLLSRAGKPDQARRPRRVSDDHADVDDALARATQL
jgi:hypothetical protein